MSVSPAPSRTGWYPAPNTGPGRPPGAQRRSSGPTVPALTLTVSIPLTGDESLTAPARRLLDAARELVERGEASVFAGPGFSERRSGDGLTRPPAATPGAPALHILAASRSVLLNGEPLALTRLEFDLLLYLVAHPRRVFTRLQLLTAVWGYDHAGVRTVDVHVRRIRGKVGTDVPLVTTVYGVGYRLADEAMVTVDRTG